MAPRCLRRPPRQGRLPRRARGQRYLGNTPAVCRASYIDPRIIELYEQGETIAAALDEPGKDGVFGHPATRPPTAASSVPFRGFSDLRVSDNPTAVRSRTPSQVRCERPTSDRLAGRLTRPGVPGPHPAGHVASRGAGAETRSGQWWRGLAGRRFPLSPSGRRRAVHGSRGTWRFSADVRGAGRAASSRPCRRCWAFAATHQGGAPQIASSSTGSISHRSPSTPSVRGAAAG